MTRPSDKDILEALSASAALGGIVDPATLSIGRRLQGVYVIDDAHTEAMRRNIEIEMEEDAADLAQSLGIHLSMRPMRGSHMTKSAGSVFAHVVRFNGLGPGLGDQRITAMALMMPPHSKKREGDTEGDLASRHYAAVLAEFTRQFEALVAVQVERLRDRADRGFADGVDETGIAHLSIDADALATIESLHGGHDGARAELLRLASSKPSAVKRGNLTLIPAIQLKPLKLGPEPLDLDAFLNAGPLINLNGGPPSTATPDLSSMPMTWYGGKVEMREALPDSVVSVLIGRPFGDLVADTPIGHRIVRSVSRQAGVTIVELETNERVVGK